MEKAVQGAPLAGGPFQLGRAHHFRAGVPAGAGCVLREGNVIDVTAKLCKEGLLKLAALLDKLPADAEINRADAEWNGAAEVLLRKGLDEVAAAYNLEIKERRLEYEDSCYIQRTAVLDGILLVQIVSVPEGANEEK